jgi:hypothetical protein
MKKILAIMLMPVLFSGHSYTSAEKHVPSILEAERQFVDFLPQLEDLGDRYPNEVEIQLGLASVYENCRPPDGSSVIEQYDRVLSLDPKNRAAYTAKARLICVLYTAKRRDFLEELEGVIANAKRRNRTELVIPKYSRLYKWFRNKGDEGLVHIGFDVALQQLTQKFDQEIPTVLSVLRLGQQIDPQNALYDYLRAHLYLELGDKGKGLREIQNGAAKQYWNNYPEETSKARSRVAEEAGLPKEVTDFVEYCQPIRADFLRGQIWEDGIVAFANTYEAQGDFENAESMYILTIRLAKQIKEEPVPYSAQYNKRLGETLENWAHERLEQLHDKMSEDSQENR